jgi:hypothetical protein
MTGLSVTGDEGTSLEDATRILDQVRLFKRSAVLLGGANMTSGFITVALWDPTSSEWFNWLMLGWGMGVSLGFSILLCVSLLHKYQTKVENEGWFFYSFTMALCILLSFLLPTFPIAFWTWWRFKQWCNARIKMGLDGMPTVTRTKPPEK